MAKKWDEKDEFSFVTNLHEAGKNPISLAFIFECNFILITGRVVMGYEL